MMSVILRAGNQGVRVRAFAGLHVLDELRRLRVGHVEDAHAGHVVLRILHAPFAAIIAVARALGGQEEQVADDGRITLRCDALRTPTTITGLAGSVMSQIVKPAKLA